MCCLKNEHGSVLVFITLMIVLLMIMVGMGLDTGHLAYVRSTSQPAVDAAALAAVTGIPSGSFSEVKARAVAFNGSNTYSTSNQTAIQGANVTLMEYTPGGSPELKAATSISTANAARVALESKNPYDGSATNTPLKSPLFLTPLFNLFGKTQAGTQDVSVSAVAIIKATPDLPIAAQQLMCGTKSGGSYVEQTKVKLLQAGNNSDTSGYTTFYINSASKTQVTNMLNGAITCTGAPSVDVGFCTQLNNGQVMSLYDEFQGLFNVDTSRCYFIPIITDGVTFNSCSNILDFAKFCPINGDDGFGLGKTKSADGKGWDKYIYGNLTCGQQPTRSQFAKCQVPILVRDTSSGM